jgi:uncharacterized protein (DUF2237 family)
MQMVILPMKWRPRKEGRGSSRALNVPRRDARAVRARSGHRLLPRRLLQHRLRDVGIHVDLREDDREFLAFSKKRGNDLSTPVPDAGFPGPQAGGSLVPVRRPLEGSAGCRCRASGVPQATHEETLAIVPLAVLKRHAIDIS